jgi:hypothetical protein
MNSVDLLDAAIGSMMRTKAAGTDCVDPAVGLVVSWRSAP